MLNDKPLEAIHLIDSLIKIDSSNSNLVLSKGYCFDLMGNYSMAKYYYCKALFLDSTNCTAHFNLGISWYNEGLRYFEKAEDPVSLEEYKDKIVESSICFYTSKIFLEKAKLICPSDSILVKTIKEINQRLFTKEINKIFGL